MNILLTVVGSLVVFVVVFGFAAYTRFLQHKENMALAEKGLLPDASERKGMPVQRWGLIFSILGLVLILAMIPFAWNNIWILFLLGLLPLGLGLGLMIIYVLLQDNPDTKSRKPPKPKSKPGKKVAASGK